MSIVGFAVMSPIATISMVDTSRWQPVVFADTPRTIRRYQEFLNEKKNGGRKPLLFLLGVTNLSKIAKDRQRFTSVLVFDDLQNLHLLSSQMSGFSIADITHKNNVPYPKHLTPVELGELLEKQGSIPETLPLLAKVTNALGRRRPSVLETTSRMPTPETAPDPATGVQRQLTDIKNALGGGTKVPFAVLLDTYVKYLFRVIERSKVTSTVTKKLPDEVKAAWKNVLDFADSDIGLTMAKAYARLCRNKDPDFRIGHAVTQFKLRPYTGDFVYFTSLFPPHRTCQFISTFVVPEPVSAASGPLIKVFKPPKPSPKATMKTKKKAGVRR